MNIFLIPLVVFAFVCMHSQTLAQNISSPLCDPTVDPLEFDTVIRKDYGDVINVPIRQCSDCYPPSLLYITGDIVTVVDPNDPKGDDNNGTIKTVSKLKDFFNTSGTNYPPVEPPVNLYFSRKSGYNDTILTLINIKNQRYWNVSRKDNRVLGSDVLPSLWSYLFNKSTIDVFSINNTNGLILYSNRTSIHGFQYELNPDLVLDSTLYYLVRYDSNKYGLLSDKSNTVAVVELHGQTITSGVIISGHERPDWAGKFRFKFFANRYSITFGRSDTGAEVNHLYGSFNITRFTDIPCSLATITTTTGTTNTTSPNPTQTITTSPTESTTSSDRSTTTQVVTKKTNGSGVWIYLLILLFIAILAIILVLIAIKYCFRSETKPNISDESQPKEVRNESIQVVTNKPEVGSKDIDTEVTTVRSVEVN